MARIEIQLIVDQYDKNFFKLKKFMRLYDFQWFYLGEDKIILSYYTEDPTKTNEAIDMVREFLLNSDYIKEVNGSFPKPILSTKAEE